MSPLPAPPARGAGRFAPTPTGPLHLGNLRTALLDWLNARASGLRTVLRIEDLDPSTIPAGCLEDQLADLKWLGLHYDEGPETGGPVGPYRQSERADLYAQALHTLDAHGLLYPCWCSRREVREAARAPHASDEGPVYAGTCRPLTPRGAPLGLADQGEAALETRRGRRPALRLDVGLVLDAMGLPGPEDRLTFTDQVAGPQRFDVRGGMGDFVVRRVDGIAAYQLACALDDHLMGCTVVLRGADLLPSAARQIMVLHALGKPQPAYAHVGLVTDPHGQRLAKRDRAIGATALREAGISAGQILKLLARLSGLPVTDDLDALTAAFDRTRLSAGPVSMPQDPF